MDVVRPGLSPTAVWCVTATKPQEAPNKLTACRIPTTYVATHGTVNSSPTPGPCDLKLRNQTSCREAATDTPCPKTRLDNAMRASSAVHLCATLGFEFFLI